MEKTQEWNEWIDIPQTKFSFYKENEINFHETIFDILGKRVLFIQAELLFFLNVCQNDIILMLNIHVSIKAEHN